MATSNFLQFNPAQANQETDAAYLTDATRTGGAGVGAIWPSNSANKTLYQVSTAVAALMQMMANKGFTVSDASLSALTTQLSNILTTADLLSNLQSVSWASSLTLNAVRYNGFEIGLSGNTTLTISGQTVGQLIVLLFSQDGTGGHTVTYPGNIVGGAQPDPSASTVSGQLFKVNTVGTLQALGPMVSSNGMSGMAMNATTLRVASAAPSGQVLTGNGTSYVPAVAPGYTTGSNSNGTWVKDPIGTLTQRGASAAFATGSRAASVAVTFPTPFATVPIVTCNADNYLQSSNLDSLCLFATNITTSGFTAVITAAVNIGGSGASGVANTIHANWIAIGS